MYTEKQLVSFGNYLLSDERSLLILSNHEGEPDPQERLNEVYDADVANWKDKEGISRSTRFGEQEN